MKKLLILTLLGVLFVPMVGSAKADEVFKCTGKLVDLETNMHSISSTSHIINISGDYRKIKN